MEERLPADPFEAGEADGFEGGGEGGDVPLAVIKDKFGSGDGEAADEILGFGKAV